MSTINNNTSNHALSTILNSYYDTNQLPDSIEYQITYSDTTDNTVVDILIELCELYMTQQNYTIPIQLLTQSYQLNKTNTRIIDLLALCYMEYDNYDNSNDSNEFSSYNVDNAKQLLHESIQLAPYDNINKYCYIAQLHTTNNSYKAVECYNKAIELYNKQLNDNSSNTNINQQQDKQSIINQLCTIYVSITELYMTDLCDDINAESICNTSLDNAYKLDNTNVDVLYALANLRYIQQLYDESHNYILQAYNATIQWFDQYIAKQSAIDVVSNNNNNIDDNDINDISYETRLNIVKLLIEHEEYKKSLNILENQLLNENDYYIEVLHLTAVCYSYIHNYITSLEYIIQCDKLIRKVPKYEQPIEIVSALKQLKLHCEQQIKDDKQIDSIVDDDNDDQQDIDENNISDNDEGDENDDVKMDT